MGRTRSRSFAFAWLLVITAMSMGAQAAPRATPKPTPKPTPKSTPTTRSPSPAPHQGENDLIPLTDLGAGTYNGQQGGLYAGGSNTPPSSHAANGLSASNKIAPTNGKIGVVSIGLSNTNQEWCDAVGSLQQPCVPGTFSVVAEAFGAVGHQVGFANGAQGGATANKWADSNHEVWDTLAQRVNAAGLTASQIQVVWLKTVNANTPGNFQGAKQLETDLGKIVRNVKKKYANVKLIFLSSRIYHGYAQGGEPGAYESGFGVKWVIDAQVKQRAGGGVDPESGDLSEAAAPWIGWAAYLWANGTTPRKDGLVWLPQDFSDGTHPDPSGVAKVVNLLMGYFLSSPQACWFRTAGC